MIIGIDAHKLNESVCVTDMDGKIVEEYRMDNTEKEWNVFMGKYSKDSDVVVESSTTGKYVARLLRDNGFRIHLANPKALKIIFRSTKKTDKNDARNLAKLFRMGELPESYLPSREIDSIRSMIRYRRSPGEEVTAIKNRVHALLARNGLSVDASDIFGKRALKKMLDLSASLNETDGFILTDLLSRFRAISDNIDSVQDRLASMGKDNEYVNILMSIPGIDYYTALGIYSEIGDISRFPDADHLASYTGLVPKVDQSGSVAIYGHVTKAGPSVLRFFIVNSVHTLIKLSPTFKRLYRKMKKRIGRNRALIAVARKLAVTIYNMLAKKEEFAENHLFESLKERKLKAMEKRSGKVKEFTKEDMEKIIGEMTISSKSNKLLS